MLVTAAVAAASALQVTFVALVLVRIHSRTRRRPHAGWDGGSDADGGGARPHRSLMPKARPGVRAGRLSHRTSGPRMTMYILLMTLTPEGRQQMLADTKSMLRAEEAIDLAGVETLGLYGVLGDYDFVSILEAADNAAAAEFSLELGVRAGVHITTLPAIPVTRLKGTTRRGPGATTAGASEEAPEAASGDGEPGPGRPPAPAPP